MNWIADYHMHTRHSPDSRSTIAEMAASAQLRGLSEIAVTNHFEFFPGSMGQGTDELAKKDRLALTSHGFTLEHFEGYREELISFREQYPNTVPVRFGVEVGQPFEDFPYAQELMEAFHFDFVLGSVHNLGEIDLYLADYTKKNLDWFCRTYLEALYRLADQCDYDCLAHLDLIKRYAAFRGLKADLMDYPNDLQAVLKRVIERGKGIEINTSGIRQDVGEMLPGLQILQLYRSLGGTILTVGSDAHNPHDVGADLEAGYHLAKEAGFEAVCSFDQRKPIFHPIEE